MKTADFDFHLPDDHIALRPAEPRDFARLLVVRDGGLEDRIIRDLPDFLRPGDALVFNDTRVIPARLSGVRQRIGAEGETLTVDVEATLHHRDTPDTWSAFMKPGKRLKPGDRIVFHTPLPLGEGVGGWGGGRPSTEVAREATSSSSVSNTHQPASTQPNPPPRGEGLSAVVQDKFDDGLITLRFDLSGPALDDAIRDVGVMPLPPYIAAKRAEDDRDRSDYQTVFAEHDGSVAAPTAGLHFTPALLEALAARGVSTHAVTLHVGAGTFLPVKADDTADHKMHSEWGEVSADTAEALNAVRAAGGRIVCVGTTSLRLLESATGEDGMVRPFHGDTAIFITPGYRFRAADVLVTNFHLPKSTLFMLVSAFAGLDTMRAAYAHAIDDGYRFYSYGDGSLLFRAGLMPFPFDISATDGRARTGVLRTPRGDIRTPAFMPVGTAATVKALTVDQVAQTGADILLGNTYHLMLRPGPERMERLGGLHKFMHWDKPILTDSGGFQVMSLSGISKVKEEAVTFSSHIDGSKHVLSPERSIEIQADRIGADISMQLDQCVAYPAEKDAAQKAMELSIRWGARSKAAFGARETQALFGIQQGSTFEDLRRQSSDQLQEIGFDGYAIGGLAVGEGHQAMCEVLDYAPAMLPADRPRYLMGVGKPVDLVEAVWRGVDMFDCVLPTRAGRHGQAWTWDGPINLKNARFAEDQSALDPDVPCPASQEYSKAYLHHLIRADEILGKILLSWHNIAFFQALTAAMREAIAHGRFDQFRRDFHARHVSNG